MDGWFNLDVKFKLIFLEYKGRLQLKILVVFTTKAGPLPPGKALVVQNSQKKFTKVLSSWSDTGKKNTKDLVVGPTPPTKTN